MLVRRITLTILALTLLFSACPIAAFADSAKVGVPTKMDSTMRSLSTNQIGANSSLPASYFLTNQNQVTPVKLQSPWRDCWAFAIATAIESSILKSEQMFDTKPAPSLEPTASPKLLSLNDSIDISERAIAWFAHELQTEASAGSQAGEGFELSKNGALLNQLPEGNFKLVEPLLAANQLLVTEEAVPYKYNNYAGNPLWLDVGTGLGAKGDARTKNWSVDESLRANNIDWSVTDIYRMKSPANIYNNPSTGQSTYAGYDEKATTEIKNALVNVGGVAIALDCEFSIPSEVASGTDRSKSGAHISYNTWAQYNASSSVDYNHAVTIVGWDDNFSADNFSGTASGKPPANGAWVCKNNWGSDAFYKSEGAVDKSLHWGIQADPATGEPATGASANSEASGFFWLSYYDHTIQDPTAFAVYPTNESELKTYQYDYLGSAEYARPSTYTGEVWVGNVFCAENVEMLDSVGVETFSENETVEIKVYTLDDKNLDGMLVQASAKTTLPTAGFHILKLSRPVLIAANERFFVATKVSKQNAAGAVDSYLSLEAAFDTPAPNMTFLQSKAVSNPGETFVSTSPDAWVSVDKNDVGFKATIMQSNPGVTFGNALVKAFTRPTTIGAKNQTYIVATLN